MAAMRENPSLQTSDGYAQLIEKAGWSHQNHRSVFHIKDEDVTLARLYCYGYRSQTIGAFHACREAAQSVLESEGDNSKELTNALHLLAQLADMAILPVPQDFRTLLFTLYYYHLMTQKTAAALERYCAARNSPKMETIKSRFISKMGRIAGGNGIFVAKDNVMPEQASFKVPNLGIIIVPLIYGDCHSWNSAHVPGHASALNTHRHRQGMEIHLGFSPIHGKTILGESYTELHEGYAMPIPALTDHGFENLSGHDHLVPFVFGSVTLGGWGVFSDIEPRPKRSADLQDISLQSPQMNGSIYLERELSRIEKGSGSDREIVIPSSATASHSPGGLELGIGRAGPEGLSLTETCFRILSLQRGTARIRIGPVTSALEEHDHVGIPGGMEAEIVPKGKTSVVFLDTFLRDDYNERRPGSGKVELASSPEG